MIERAGTSPVAWPATVVKAYLVVGAATLAVGTGLAVFMAFEMWDPPSALGEEFYRDVFTAHGAVSMWGGLVSLAHLLVANLVIADVLRPVPPRLRALPWIGLAACILVVAWIAAPWMPGVPTWLSGVDPVVSVATIAGLYAVAFGATAVAAIAAFRRRSTALSPSGFAAAGGAIGCLLWQTTTMTAVVWMVWSKPADTVWLGGLGPSLGQIRLACAASVVCLLPHAIERATGRPFGPPWAIAAVALSFALPAVWASASGLAFLVGGTIAVVCTARSLLGAERPLSAAALYALIVALPMLALAAVFQAFVAVLKPDVHLHDTWFATAGFHAFAFACVAIVLTALLAAAERLHLRPSASLARASPWLAGPATIVFIAAIAHAGARGRAMRYGEYFPEIELTHRLAAAATIALALAGLLLAAAFLRRGRNVVPYPTPTQSSGAARSRRLGGSTRGLEDREGGG